MKIIWFEIFVLFVFIVGQRWSNAQQCQSLRDATDSFLAELKANKNDVLLFWSGVSLESCRLDFDPDLSAKPSQGGPTGTSRALAIIHWAMADSYNVFLHEPNLLIVLDPFPQICNVSRETAAAVAIGEAAFQTLSFLFPKQVQMFNELHDAFLQQFTADGNSNDSVQSGISVGKLVAAAVLAARSNDGSTNSVPCNFVDAPGYYASDPTTSTKTCLGPQWGAVKPFVIDSGSQFRPWISLGTDPKSRLTFLNSTRFVRNLLRVKYWGARDSRYRTEEQTQIGIFWGYDGATRIGCPPRLYNQVARAVAIKLKNSLQQNVELFAMINLAMADACIAAWEAKYYYNLWRPITGIRAGFLNISADPNWTPLGAPACAGGSYSTPPFPSYVSGHAAFGSAVFEVLRRFYQTDCVSFSFQSEEYNGKTVDALTLKPRPAITRNYTSFTQAEWENRLSRIYLGVHWGIDQSDGTTLGRRVGAYVFDEMSSK